MKQIIFTILIVLAGISAMATPLDSLQKGNDYYIAEQYNKAISAYQSVMAEGYESAELYYNLGNAYYKNNEPVQAILYYEKAKLLAPNNEDIQFNLDLVNQFVVDKIEPLPRPFFITWFREFTQLLHADTWGLISLLMFVLTLVFGLGYAFLRKTGLRKLSFALAIIMLLGSTFAFVLGSQQKKITTSHNHAIIFDPSVTVKASPNESSVDLFVIHEGLKVQILQELNGWLEVKLADGNRGWVQQEVLKII